MMRRGGRHEQRQESGERGRGAGRAARHDTLELLLAMTISRVISAMVLLSWVALLGRYANSQARQSDRFALRDRSYAP